MAMSNHSQHSTGSGGFRSSRSKNERQVLCYHDEVAPFRVVRFNGPTAGKRFYGCSYWPVNEVNEIRDLQYKCSEKDTEIADLEVNNNMLEEKVKRQKEIISKQEDQIQELAIENTEMREGLLSAKSDRTLALALVVSWVFLPLFFCLFSLVMWVVM
ncbi:Lymphoid-restricted membrane protein [Bienertia sinuspersici]